MNEDFQWAYDKLLSDVIDDQTPVKTRQQRLVKYHSLSETLSFEWDMSIQIKFNSLTNIMYKTRKIYDDYYKYQKTMGPV